MRLPSIPSIPSIPSHGARRRWTPAALFRAGEDGYWIEADAMKLWANIEKTVPAQPGDRIAAVDDGSPNGLEFPQPNVALQPRFRRAPLVVRNRIPNNTPQGAVLGVIGSGGALPDGWLLQSLSGTAAVVGIGADYVDLTINNTASSGATRLEFSPIIATANGQDWTLSVSVARLSGSVSGAPELRLSLRNNVGSGIASTLLASLSLASTLTRFSGGTVLVTSGVEGLVPDFRVVHTAPWTATFRLSLPQLERGTVATPVQITRANGLDVTEDGVPSFNYIRFDLDDDVLPTLLAGGDYDLFVAGRNGCWIEPAITIGAGGASNIGPATITGGPAGLLAAVGDIAGVLKIDRATPAIERDRLHQHYVARGAGPMLEAI